MSHHDRLYNMPVEYLGQSMPPEMPFPDAQPMMLQSEACIRPNPDMLRTVWKAELVGRGSSFIPHTEPAARAEVHHLMPSATRDDPRIWTPNLNDAILERIRASNPAKWDVYQHMQARQKFQQFLAADVLHRRDKYMREVPVQYGEQVEQKYLKQIMPQEPQQPQQLPDGGINISGSIPMPQPF